jgi:hypothetical protein
MINLEKYSDHAALIGRLFFASMFLVFGYSMAASRSAGGEIKSKVAGWPRALSTEASAHALVHVPALKAHDEELARQWCISAGEWLERHGALEPPSASSRDRRPRRPSG